MNVKIYFVIGCCFFLFSSVSYSFEDEEVHPEINERAVKQSILGEFLKNELRVLGGIDEYFLAENGESEKVFEWLRIGGTDEDADLRFLNHFHDPTLDWEEAELWGWVKASSVIWAQSEKNDSSWAVARSYYYQAILSGDEDSFVSTFKTVGQLMHLVSDMAVPAHVRDDAHLENWLAQYTSLPITHFELYTRQKVNSLTYTGFTPDAALFTDGLVAGYVPISALWDMEKYDKTNPSVTQTTLIGLAEYTNANYLSEGTIFKDYDYPKEGDTDVRSLDWANPDVIVREDDNSFYYKMHIRRNGDTDSNNYLASAGYHLSDELDNNVSVYSLILDDEVYDAYAKELVRRAVGYSAALLDYFFRGKFEVDAVPLILGDFVHGVIYFVTNKSEIVGSAEGEEDFGVGKIMFVQDYTSVNGSGGYDFLDMAVEQELTALAFDEKTFIPLYFSEPMPLENLASLNQSLCRLAFAGKIGNEENGVAGKVFTPGGELLVNEEWYDIGGAYNWLHTSSADTTNNGTNANYIVGNVLHKESIRTIGDEGRENKTDFDLTTDANFPEGLPVTPHTYIEYKVDNISIVNKPVAPEGYTSDYQVIWLYFNNGLIIQLSGDGSFIELTPDATTAYWQFSQGQLYIDNIHDIFNYHGIALPDFLYLQKISFDQHLYDTDEDSVVEQYMDIDCFRIIEGQAEHIHTVE